MLAWSVAVLVSLMALATMVLVVPVEGWNIVHDIETRTSIREKARQAIARREAILGPDAGPWTGTDPNVKSVLDSLDDPLAVPMGAAQSSLERLWAMARFTNVPRGGERVLQRSSRGRFFTTSTTLVSSWSHSVDPWKFAAALRPVLTPMPVLLVAMVVMSGFGLRISRGFDRTRASGWVQLRLALLSSGILLPVLLYIGVRLGMSDALSGPTTLTRSLNELRLVPLQAAAGGLLLLAAWWWGAFQMLQVRMALLTAGFMVFLITLASLILIPASLMLYWYLTGQQMPN